MMRTLFNNLADAIPHCDITRRIAILSAVNRIAIQYGSGISCNAVAVVAACRMKSEDYCTNAEVFFDTIYTKDDGDLRARDVLIALSDLKRGYNSDDFHVFTKTSLGTCHRANEEELHFQVKDLSFLIKEIHNFCTKDLAATNKKYLEMFFDDMTAESFFVYSRKILPLVHYQHKQRFLDDMLTSSSINDNAPLWKYYIATIKTSLETDKHPLSEA